MQHSRLTPLAIRTLFNALTALVVVSTVAIATSLSCSPGELDCEAAGTCGTGGTGGVTFGPPPVHCTNVNPANTSLQAVEANLIVSRCGTGAGATLCHGLVFPPKMTDLATLRMNILAPSAMNVRCASDPYINKTAPGKSYMLAKIANQKDMKVTCPNGDPDGGERMPAVSVSPAKVPLLNTDEFECLKWYIEQLATH